MFDWSFNEYWFLLQALITLSIVLFCFRLGKNWVISYVGMAVILMNLVVMKQVNLFGLEATLGNVLYASIFFATDLLSEHHGRKEAFRAVRIGFFAGILAMLTLQFAVHYAPSEYDFAQDSFALLFSLTPRIVVASLLSYLITQNLDVWVYHLLKKATKGRFLWIRNMGSTTTAQLVDSFFFTYVAFYGHFDALFEIALFTFLIKFMVAVLDTPFIYLSKLSIFEPENVRKREHTWVGRLMTKISGEE